METFWNVLFFCRFAMALIRCFIKDLTSNSFSNFTVVPKKNISFLPVFVVIRRTKPFWLPSTMTKCHCQARGSSEFPISFTDITTVFIQSPCYTSPPTTVIFNKTESLCGAMNPLQRGGPNPDAPPFHLKSPPFWGVATRQEPTLITFRHVPPLTYSSPRLDSSPEEGKAKTLKNFFSALLPRNSEPDFCHVYFAAAQP